MRIVIFGDSISDGIGSKHINYEKDLISLIEGLEIFNYAKSGETILYANNQKEEASKHEPEIAIIFCGSVDGLIRANLEGSSKFVKWIIPKRYKNPGMLEQRPFYSKNFFKRQINHIDNIYRKILKKIVLASGGKTQRVQIDLFKKEYKELVKYLTQNNINCILVSTMYVDDKFFLKSNNEFIKYNEIIRQCAIDYAKNAVFLDLFSIIQKDVKENGWSNLLSFDHFHPNIRGYRRIAEEIVNAINIFR